MKIFCDKVTDSHHIQPAGRQSAGSDTVDDGVVRTTRGTTENL